MIDTSARIAEIEADGLVHQDPAIAEIIAIIEQILGCGRVTAVTVTAVMRKLITIINARVRDAHHQPTTELS